MLENNAFKLISAIKTNAIFLYINLEILRLTETKNDIVGLDCTVIV